jgi:choline-glycine betaine transporter
MAFSRRTWIGLVVADAVLFLIANVTTKNSHHPGTVSNVFWVAFLIGTALLILLAIVAVIQRLRPRAS